MPPIAVKILIFLVQCVVLHVFIRKTNRGYDKGFFSAVVCVGLALILHMLASKWIQPFINIEDTTRLQHVSLALLFICATFLIRLIMQPGIFRPLIAGVVFIALTYGLQIASKKYTNPDSPEHQALANLPSTLGVERPDSETNTNAIDVANIAKGGLDGINALSEDKSLKSDFNRGLSLLKERKAMMDTMSPEEKAAYRAEMNEFMSEQGLAQTTPSSPADLKSVNPTNMTAMASLFDYLEKTEAGSETDRSQQITASLTKMTGHLEGMNATDQNISLLQSVSEMLATNNTEAAMEKVQKQLNEADGQDQFAETMMAALMQAKSGTFSNVVVKSTSFDLKSLLSLKKEPELEPTTTTPEVDEEQVDAVKKTSLADVSLEEVSVKVSDDTHIPISAQLGLVHVPAEEESLGDWISAVHSIRVNGYASLNDETAILLDDGTMYRNDDIWQMENNGFRYRFSIDKVFKNKVHMTGIDRVDLSLPESETETEQL